MKPLFFVQSLLVVCCSNVSSPASAPAARLAPVMPKAPALNCMQMVEDPFAKTAGLFWVGMPIEKFHNILSDNQIQAEQQESRGYFSTKPGEPVVHSTSIDIVFTCENIKVKASLDNTFREVEKFFFMQEDLDEKEAKKYFEELHNKRGEATRTNSYNYESVQREDLCWKNQTVEVCMMLIQDKTQNEWKFSQTYTAQ